MDKEIVKHLKVIAKQQKRIADSLEQILPKTGITLEDGTPIEDLEEHNEKVKANERVTIK